MKQICPTKFCMGCTACMNVCQHSAISMKADKYGFYYPKIDQDICIDCGLCVATCPVNHPVKITYPSDCYAVLSDDKEEIKKVASGGMASVLSRYVLRKGGVVYGSCGVDIRNVHHIRIDSMKDLDKLRGSKYVQSYMGNIYSQVKKDLQENKMVLFTGTPCQVAGLKAFLHKKEYENLYTVDLICHGVPSQQMLNDNINSYTKYENNSCRVAFRLKPCAVNQPNVIHSITFGWFFQSQPCKSDSQIYVPWYKDAYMLGFIGCLIFRPNCYECRYACVARCGDFTVGDFWGLAKDAGFNDTDGVSLVFINSIKASKIWIENLNICKSVKRSVIEAIKGNGQLQQPSSKPITYERFRELYPLMPFKEAVYACSKWRLRQVRREKVKKFIKRVLKK